MKLKWNIPKQVLVIIFCLTLTLPFIDFPCYASEIECVDSEEGFVTNLTDTKQPQEAAELITELLSEDYIDGYLVCHLKMPKLVISLYITIAVESLLIRL